MPEKAPTAESLGIVKAPAPKEPTAESLGIVKAPTKAPSMESLGITAVKPQQAPEIFKRQDYKAEPTHGTGIIQRPEEGTSPEEVFKGAKYWGARVGAIGEELVLGTVDMPLALERWRRLRMPGTDRLFMSNETLKKASTWLDPATSPIAILTPDVMKTRAYRDIAARERGTGAQILNSTIEGGLDLASFIGIIVASRRLPGGLGKLFKPTGKAVATLGRLQKLGLAATRAASKGKTVGLLGRQYDYATAARLFRAVRVGQIARHSSVLGIHGILTSHGSMEDRVKHGLMRSLYSFTPAISGSFPFTATQATIGKIPAGPVAAIMTDWLLNTGITTATVYKQLHKEYGFGDQFFANAVPQLIFDLGMSLSTRSLIGKDLSNKTMRAVHDKEYDALKATDNDAIREPVIKKGEKGETVVDSKVVSKEEYHEKKMSFIDNMLSKVEISDKVSSPVERKDIGIVESVGLAGKEESKVSMVEPASKVEQSKGNEGASHTFKNMKWMTAEGTPLEKIIDFPAELQGVLYKMMGKESPEEREIDFKNFMEETLTGQVYWSGRKGDSVKDSELWYKGDKYEGFDRLLQRLNREEIPFERISLHRSNIEGGATKFGVSDLKDAMLRGIKQNELNLTNLVASRDRVETALAFRGLAEEARADAEKPLNTQDLIDGRVPPGTHIVRDKDTEGAFLTKWDVGVLNKLRGIVRYAKQRVPAKAFAIYRSDAPPALFQMKYESQHKAFRGGDVAGNTVSGKVVVNGPQLQRVFREYDKGNKIMKEGIIEPRAEGKEPLSFNQFKQYVAMHERVHLLTGLDGGKYDENMVNTISLELIGRRDIARTIEEKMLPKGTKIEEPIKKKTAISTGVPDLDKLALDDTLRDPQGDGRFNQDRDRLANQFSALGENDAPRSADQDTKDTLHNKMIEALDRMGFTKHFLDDGTFVPVKGLGIEEAKDFVSKELTPGEQLYMARLMEIEGAEIVKGEDPRGENEILEGPTYGTVVTPEATRDGTTYGDVGITTARPVSPIVNTLSSISSTWKRQIKKGSGEALNAVFFKDMFDTVMGARTGDREQVETMGKRFDKYLLPFKKIIGEKQFSELFKENVGQILTAKRVAIKWHNYFRDAKKKGQAAFEGAVTKTQRDKALETDRQTRDSVNRSMKAEFDEVLASVPKSFRPTLEKELDRVWKIMDVSSKERMEDDHIANSFPSMGSGAPAKDAPASGPDGKDAQRFSKRLRTIFGGLDFFGVRDEQFNEFDKSVSSKRAERTTEEVVTEFLSEKRTERWASMVKVRGQDVILQSIWDTVCKQKPIDGKWTDRRINPERQSLLNTYNSLLNRMFEEIGHNEGDSLTKYFYTDTGQKAPYSNPEEKKAVIKHYTRLRAELGEPKMTAQQLKALSQGRDEGLYWKLAPTHIQNLALWVKADIERPLLKQMIQSGAMDNSRLYANWKRGFIHRAHGKAVWQAGGGGFAPLRDDHILAQKYRTYDEFFEATAGEKQKAKSGAGLVVPDDFSINVADYIGDSLTRVKRQGLINGLKTVKNPEMRKLDNGTDAGIIVYPRQIEKLAKKYNKIKGLTLGPNDSENKKFQGIMTEWGYREVKGMSGLAQYGKGGYQIPWVHKSVVDKIDNLIGAQTKDDWIKGWNRINGTVKRMVMFSPNLFAIQIASTPMAWINPIKSLKYGLAPLNPLDKNSFLRGGLRTGYRRSVEGAGLNDHLVGRGYNQKLLEGGIKYGLRGFDAKFTMNAMFDKVQQDLKHPLVMSKTERLKENLGQKGGIDEYVFNSYVGKMMYEYYDMLYNRFLRKGKSDDEAMKLAAYMANDTTGMLDSAIYGKEGRLLQGMLFARDFTMSFLRMTTGALGLKQEYQGVGWRKYTNSLLHGEKTNAEFNALVPMYRQHLARIMLSKFLLVNLFQFALSHLNEEDEEKGRFAFENEPGKKFAIRLPWRDEEDRWIYTDMLALREANQMADILSTVPGLKHYMGGRGVAAWAKSKANYGINTTLALLSNADFTGKPLSSSSEAVSVLEKARDYGSYMMNSAVPTFARSDVKKVRGFFLSQLAGAPLKRGKYPYEAGFPWQEQKKYGLMVDRENYERLKMQKFGYTLTLKQAMDWFVKGEVSRSQVENKLYMQSGSPASYIMKKNMGAIKSQMVKEKMREWGSMLE